MDVKLRVRHVTLLVPRTFVTVVKINRKFANIGRRRFLSPSHSSKKRNLSLMDMKKREENLKSCLVATFLLLSRTMSMILGKLEKKKQNKTKDKERKKDR